MIKNTASQVISAQLIATADGSNVTSGTTTVYVTGDGGTQASGTGTVTHEGNGCWSYVPTQAETNYDHVSFTFVNTSAVTATVNVYTRAATPDVNAAQFGGSATAASNAATCFTGTITTLDALDTAQDSQHATTQSAVSTAQADLDILTGTNGVTLASSQPNYAPVVSSDLPANFADLTISVTTGLVSLSADQSGVTIGTANSVGALGAQAKLDVNAECDTALADYDAVVPADLPTNFGSMVISGAGAVDSLVQGFLNNTIAETTADNIAANFEVFFDNGNAITTKVVNDVGVAGSGLTAQQVWEYDISSIVTTGQAGSELNDASAGGGATAGEIADAVLDEALSGHTTAGTLGKAISDTLADTNELQGDWADGGRLDLILDARASQASVDVIDGIVDSILVDTATTIPATLATLATSSALATVDANVDAIVVDTGTSIPAQITALNDLSAAEMRSAVGLASANLDSQLASLTSDVSEPGIPGATATVPEMVATLYGMARNRIDVTSSAKTFYNDAGTAVWSKTLSDNGTTYTEAEGA